VEGSEGVRGGWRLARDPTSISVLDIAEAARGGDEPLFECREIRARCALWPDEKAPRPAVTGLCSIHAVMLAAESAMRRELGSHTLADLNARVGAKSSWTPDGRRVVRHRAWRTATSPTAAPRGIRGAQPGRRVQMSPRIERLDVCTPLWLRLSPGWHRLPKRRSSPGRHASWLETGSARASNGSAPHAACWEEAMGICRANFEPGQMNVVPRGQERRSAARASACAISTQAGSIRAARKRESRSP
jgi:DNA-binding IscR family transcriptional regulator